MFSNATLRSLTVGAALCVAAGLAACDGGADADLETTTTPATGDVVPPAALTEADVDEVHFGRSVGPDMRITDATDDFAPSDSILVSIKTDLSSAGSTLTAHWTTESDSLLHEETKTVAGTGEQWTTFTFPAGRNLPEGDYELHILLNGQEVEEREFSIERPRS